MRPIEGRALWLGNAGDLRNPGPLFAAGIEAVVELADSEPAAVLPREMIRCRFPLSDGGDNDAELLRLAAESVAALLRTRVSTIVCCSAGLSRSICVAAAGLALAEGQPLAEALKLVVGAGPADVSPGLSGANATGDPMSDSANPAPGLHCAVFFALFAAINLAFPRIGWPWHFVVPLSLYAATLFVPKMRQSVPPLAIGRLGGAPLGFAVLVSVVSSGVLLGYDDLFWPNVDDLAAGIPLTLLESAGLASIVFAVVNAACEELAFRWLFWDAVAAEWNQTAALVATSVLFGLAHWLGYPPGPVGAILAAVYGLVLGCLRWWTGGLGLAIACHVLADFTIFVILSRR